MYHPNLAEGKSKEIYESLVKWTDFKPNLEKLIDSYKEDWTQHKECLFKISQSFHDDQDSLGITFLKRILEKEPDNAKINYYAAMACQPKVEQREQMFPYLDQAVKFWKPEDDDPKNRINK